MRIANRHLGVAALLCAALGAEARAQEALRLEPSAVLTDPTGEAGITSSTLLVRLPVGSFLMPEGFEHSYLSLFDAAGRLTGRVGRQGQGPGEYGGIASLDIDELGRVHVFDRRNGRHSVLSPSLELLSTRSVGVPMASVARLAGDTLAVSNAVLVGSREVVVIVDDRGRPVRSVGGEADASREKPIPLLAAAGGGRFWSIHPWRYELSLFDAGGARHRLITREVPWFPSRADRPPLFSPDQPPVTRVAAFRRLADGRLAVMIHVADPDWRSSIRPSDGPFGGWTTDRPERVWDTVIEVLDDSGRPLLTGRFDHYLIGFADDEHVYAYVEDELGEPRIEVYRVE